MVSSYYSGLDTRCGKNPWPGDANLPGDLGDIEVVGVLHRRTTTERGHRGSEHGARVGRASATVRALRYEPRASDRFPRQVGSQSRPAS